MINVSIIVNFDFTYSGLHRCIVFFSLFVSLLHYLAIHPSRLQGCSNKISCQLSVVTRIYHQRTRSSDAASYQLRLMVQHHHKPACARQSPMVRINDLDICLTCGSLFLTINDLNNFYTILGANEFSRGIRSWW